MISKSDATEKATVDRLAETRQKIDEIMTRYFMAFGGEDGRKTEAYKQICEQLCLVDGGHVEWSWNYLSQVSHGKIKPSIRFARAIDIYHAQLMKHELMVVVPASHVYDPAVQTVKPITKSGKPDTRIRLHTTVNRAVYEAVKGQAEFEGTTMSEIVSRGLGRVLYDYKAIKRRAEQQALLKEVTP